MYYSIRSFLLTGLVLILPTAAQVSQLDQYINEGLSNSLIIKQEQAEKLMIEQTFGETRSRFFPSLRFTSRYTRADGGRTVTLPVGEIMREMNPLLLGPGTNALEPMTISIVPETEQETKFQLTQPLFAPALIANYRMNRELYTMSSSTVQSAANTLIRDIRLAYYNCLQSREVETVYKSACKRSSRQFNITQKLYNAGMATETFVLGAQAAHEANETTYAKSNADFNNACKALNLLLNKPLNDTVILVPPDSALLFALLSTQENPIEYFDSLARHQRPELKQLEAARAASGYYVAIEKCSFAPTLAAAIEGGIIGDHFEVTDHNTFYTASLLLQWELFSGFGRINKVKKASTSIKKNDYLIADTKKKIRFQLEKVLSDITLAQRSYRDSELSYQAADKNYQSVYKQFEQGLISSNEINNAAELLTKADAGRSIARYELFKQQAHLRYTTATDALNLFKSIVESRRTQ